MHIGRQLLGPNGGTASVFTEWMPRDGDQAVFTVELINAISGDLTVYVIHKNAEETGPGTTAGTIVTTTTTVGLHAAKIGPLREQVRYRIDVRGLSAIGAILYRMHAPTWFDTARA